MHFFTISFHPLGHSVVRVFMKKIYKYAVTNRSLTRIFLIVWSSIFVVLLKNNQQKRLGSNMTLLIIPDLPQHVSASYCHHQGVVVTSEATQAVCIVDVNGLRPVQSVQLVTSLDNWPIWTARNPYPFIIQTAWVASEVTTTPWWWQWLAETCWCKSRNALIKSCYFLGAFFGCFIRITLILFLTFRNRAFCI
jgi:hypothetical protein